MDNLQTIAGKNGCGKEVAQTGKLGCQIEFATPMHLFKFKKGLVVPATTVLTKAYLDNLIQVGKMNPIVDASSFEDLSSEDTMSTNTKGIERLNLQGLAKYKFMYEEGHEFYKELAKITSFKNDDFWIGDEFGNLKIAINSDGDFVGFSAGQVLSMMTKTKVMGGDAESKSLTVQFLNRKQWDENYTIVTTEQLGFDLIEVQGVNPVELEMTAVPTNTDTVLTFKAVLESDRDTNVEGLIATNLVATVDGASNVIVSVTELANVYTMTLTDALTTGQVLLIEFWDSSTNSKVIISEGVLYGTSGDTETVLV
jgi:hypothetical protein